MNYAKTTLTSTLTLAFVLAACDPERDEAPSKPPAEAGTQQEQPSANATPADASADDDASTASSDAAIAAPDASDAKDAAMLADASGATFSDAGSNADAGAATPDASPTQADASADATTPMPTEAVDLLFVIDNSGSMASEQVRLAAELDRLVRILTLGDRTPDAPSEANRSNKARYFNPVKDLHVGVVSTNVGGIDNPPTAGEAVLSCAGFGDAGRLQSSTTIAAAGVTAGRATEFEGFASGEVVLPPDPSCAVPAGPPYLTFVARANEQPAGRLRCISKLGVRGCPFEQPLEAMRQALGAPSWGATAPVALEVQAHNAGFLREQAVLAVVLVSDEDDCSIRETGKPLFDTARDGDAEMKYGAKINLRCAVHGEAQDLLLPVDAYTSFLESLKPGHPERVLLASIVGVPQAVATSDIDSLLARPELQFREAGDSGLLEPSCVRPDPARPERSDKAYPPRRILKLAKQLGARASVHSICADSYAPALTAMVDRFAPLVGP